ncbi:MAG: hypothetical protein GXO88_00165 [Chlorobi bacterium]|nr:hypothetical protein [Chlorobiota bacterium]
MSIPTALPTSKQESGGSSFDRTMTGILGIFIRKEPILPQMGLKAFFPAVW